MTWNMNSRMSKNILLTDYVHSYHTNCCNRFRRGGTGVARFYQHDKFAQFELYYCAVLQTVLWDHVRMIRTMDLTVWTAETCNRNSLYYGKKVDVGNNQVRRTRVKVYLLVKGLGRQYQWIVKLVMIVAAFTC